MTGPSQTPLRTAEKQLVLHNSFTTSLSALETEVTELIDQRNESVSNKNQDHITRLAALIEKKADIEMKIWELVKDMEVLVARKRMELGVVIEGRMQDVRDAMERVEKDVNLSESSSGGIVGK